MNKQMTKVISNTGENLNAETEGERLQQVNSYTYLGHNLRIDAETQEAKIDRKMTLGWVFNKLSYILKNKHSPFI